MCYIFKCKGFKYIKYDITVCHKSHKGHEGHENISAYLHFSEFLNISLHFSTFIYISHAILCIYLHFSRISLHLTALGRDDFRFFWNFITASQILPCVIETQRYGYIRDSGSRVETPHRATIGCEKFYNGCFHCCGHFWDKYTSALVHNFVCYQNSEIWLYTGLWK